MSMKRIGFVGGGNMAEAMLSGIFASKLVSPDMVSVAEPRPERCAELRERFGVGVARDLADLCGRSGTVVFAVKPQVLPGVLREISKCGREGKLFVSIAAGAKTDGFLSILGQDSAVVRAMPNTPAQVGLGSTGLFFTPTVSPEQREWALAIFSSFGVVAEFPREDLLDAVTALSGSGPAYVFLMIEAMADGAVRAGMGREEAMRLAASTVEGAARMVRETRVHPGQLKDMVMSPGGTTAAGVAALEEGAFRSVVMSAVRAAWLRCRELSE